jgi:acyl carrier protein
MSIEEFIQKIEEEFTEIKPGTLKPDDNYQEILEWSSLNALLFMALIKSECGAVISEDELKNCNTIREIFDKIEEDKKST